MLSLTSWRAVRADLYSQFYGNDVNFHTWGSGVVRMSGVYGRWHAQPVLPAGQREHRLHQHAPGTLAVTGGSLAASAAVDLPAPGTTLDLAGDQTVNNLSGVEGSTVAAGGALTAAGTLEPGREPGVIIDNRGTAPVGGTFDGLPEGAAVGGLRLTYHGGDGNDVVLTSGSDPTDPTPPRRRQRRASDRGGGSRRWALSCC